MGGRLAASPGDRRPPRSRRRRGGPPVAAQGRLPPPRSAPLLASCGDPGSAFSGVERIPAPDNPVRWHAQRQARAIESGLTPEPGSTLRIYNYADYLSPRVLKNFEKKYGVDIRLSTFNDADEALTKIASGNLELRPLLPELRLARPAGRGRPAAAAEP